MSEDELAQLRRLSRSTTAPSAHVTRARAILAVANGRSYSDAARESGQSTGDTVARWVARFNAEGLAAVIPRHGGGRRPFYSIEDRRKIVEIASQSREEDGGNRWSLASLQKHLEVQGLPSPSIYTLWTILREADLESPNSRSARRSRPAVRYPLMANDKANVASEKS